MATRLRAAQPVRYQGTVYASITQLRRQRRLGGDTVLRLLARGEIERLERGNTPVPRVARAAPVAGSGAVPAARRIQRAATGIAEVAATLNPGHAAVALHARRTGLIKAIIHYRQRFGVGVLHALDGGE